MPQDALGHPRMHVEITQQGRAGAPRVMNGDPPNAGINTEAKYLLLRHAFEDQGAIRVAIKTDLRNVRSQRAIEGLGAAREGVWRKHRVLSDGYQRDSVFYSVIAPEWSSVRTLIEARMNRTPNR